MSWRDGVVEDEAVTLEELKHFPKDGSRLLWIDLVAPTAADMEILAEHLDLTPQTVEDVLAPLERPKFVRAADHTFFMTYALGLRDRDGGAERLTLTKISQHHDAQVGRLGCDHRRADRHHRVVRAEPALARVLAGVRVVALGGSDRHGGECPDVLLPPARVALTSLAAHHLLTCYPH